MDIRANSVLPANREALTLATSDGLSLVGELATPVDREPTATLVCVHPLPTAGGMMDSHLLRKASWRLPALAGIAVLRFNTRGTQSAAGRSEGEFDEAQAEGLDLAAAVDYAVGLGLPIPWLLGWSFGTDVILKHAEVEPVEGAILISPPLRYSTVEDLAAWSATRRPVTALIPELDDYLRPAEARQRFEPLSQARLIAVPKAGHLWVGEPFTRIVLNEIVRIVLPATFGETDELPTSWDGPMQRWSDL